MNNCQYGRCCYNCCEMQPSCPCCKPGPRGPAGPQGPPGPVLPARTICVQLPTLFSTQTTSASDTSQLSFIRVTPPGTYTAPFTVQSIVTVAAFNYNVFDFSVTPPSVPGEPSVITMTMEVPLEIRAVDANAARFAIAGSVFIPVSVSVVLPANFTSRNLQALATLVRAEATITSLTEVEVTAEYILCFNAFQPEMVSLQAGLTACGCNGIPIVVGGA